MKAEVLKSLDTALALNNMKVWCIKELKNFSGMVASKKCVWTTSFDTTLFCKSEWREERSCTGILLSFNIKTPITPSYGSSITRAWQQLMHPTLEVVLLMALLIAGDSERVNFYSSQPFVSLLLEHFSPLSSPRLPLWPLYQSVSGTRGLRHIITAVCHVCSAGQYNTGRN